MLVKNNYSLLNIYWCNSLSSGQTMDYVKAIYKKYEDYKEVTFNEIKSYV